MVNSNLSSTIAIIVKCNTITITDTNYVGARESNAKLLKILDSLAIPTLYRLAILPETVNY